MTTDSDVKRAQKARREAPSDPVSGPFSLARERSRPGRENRSKRGVFGPPPGQNLRFTAYFAVNLI